MTGLDVLYAMWVEMTRQITVPVALHLDHCPDRDVITRLPRQGLELRPVRRSKLSVEENKRQCIEVVAEARRYGADVEGEIEGFKRTEEMTGDEAEHVQSLDMAVDFVRDDRRRRLRAGHRQRPRHVQDDAHSSTPSASPTSSRRPGIPVALHGGTGMTPEQFSDLIARGLRQGQHLDRAQDRAS